MVHKIVVLLLVVFLLSMPVFAQEAWIDFEEWTDHTNLPGETSLLNYFKLNTMADSSSEFSSVGWSPVLSYELNSLVATGDDLNSMRIATQYGVVSTVDSINFVSGRIYFSPFVQPANTEIEYRIMLDLTNNWQNFDTLRVEINTGDNMVYFIGDQANSTVWLSPNFTMLHICTITIREGFRSYYGYGWTMVGIPTYLPENIIATQVFANMAGEYVFYEDVSGNSQYCQSDILFGNPTRNASRVDNVFWMANYGELAFWQGDVRNSALILLGSESDSVSLEKGEWHMVAYPGFSAELSQSLFILPPPGEPDFQIYLFEYGYQGYTMIGPDDITKPGHGLWFYASHSCVLLFTKPSLGLTKIKHDEGYVLAGDYMPPGDPGFLPPSPPEWPGSATDVNEEKMLGQPNGFSLLQNYPNPFNPVTAIEFYVPQSGKVSLKIYNSIGQEVAVLVDGVKVAGIYKVQWNAVGQYSGVYFYCLNANGLAQTKKMILMK